MIAKGPLHDIVTIVNIIVPDRHRHLVTQFCFANPPKI